MAKTKKIRDVLLDYPPCEPKEDIVTRQVKWPQSLYDFINKVATRNDEPFMHVVINVMRFWKKKQEVDNED